MEFHIVHISTSASVHSFRSMSSYPQPHLVWYMCARRNSLAVTLDYFFQQKKMYANWAPNIQKRLLRSEWHASSARGIHNILNKTHIAHSVHTQRGGRAFTMLCKLCLTRLSRCQRSTVRVNYSEKFISSSVYFSFSMLQHNKQR